MTPDELAAFAAAIRGVASVELQRLATVDLVRLAPHQRDEHTERHGRMREMAVLDEDGAAEVYAAMRALFGRDLSLVEAVAVIRRQSLPPIRAIDNDR
jgi:hypothetical protein